VLTLECWSTTQEENNQLPTKVLVFEINKNPKGDVVTEKSWINSINTKKFPLLGS
jgi:hypothetical protein